MTKRAPPATPEIHCFSVSVSHTKLKLSHTHGSHEFFLCTGRPGTQHTDANAFPMKRGDLFLFPAGQPHWANAPRGSATDGLVLNVSDAALRRDRPGEDDLCTMLDAIAARARDGHNNVGIAPTTSKLVERTLGEMDRENLRRAPGFRAAVRAGLHRFYLELLRDRNVLAIVQGKLAAPHVEERLAEVLHRIEFRYMEPFTIDAAAKLARLSRSRFHEIFKAQVGTTFVEHLTGERVRAATRMLVETDAPIIEVAYGCGFPSLSHFYHVYKKRVGRTPRAVRHGS